MQSAFPSPQKVPILQELGKGFQIGGGGVDWVSTQTSALAQIVWIQRVLSVSRR